VTGEEIVPRAPYLYLLPTHIAIAIPVGQCHAVVRPYSLHGSENLVPLIDTVSEIKFGLRGGRVSHLTKKPKRCHVVAVVGVGSEGRVRDHILLTSIELEREEPGFDRRIT
jgi:hypothetical protein